MTTLVLLVLSQVTAKTTPQEPETKQDGVKLKPKKFISSISSVLGSLKKSVDELKKDEKTLEKIDTIASQIKDEGCKIIKTITEDVPQEKLVKLEKSFKQELDAAGESIKSTVSVLEEKLNEHKQKLTNEVEETLGKETITKIKNEVEVSCKKIETTINEPDFQKNLTQFGSNVEAACKKVDKPICDLSEKLETEFNETIKPLKEKIKDK
jgi:gas vesicle protein